PQTGVATGSVTFSDGPVTLGSVTLLNGEAAITTSQLGASTHTISALFPGTASLAGSSASLIQVVAQPTATATPANTATATRPAATSTPTPTRPSGSTTTPTVAGCQLT